MPDPQEVHDEGERAAVVGFFYLQGEAHERLGEFVEDFTAQRVAVHVAHLAQRLELAGDGVVRREQAFGDVLDRHGAAGTAEELDDLPLLRAEPAQAFLVVTRQLPVHHFFERAHEVIERPGIDQQVGENEIEPRISPGQRADGIHAGAAGGSPEKLGEIDASVEPGDALQQLAGLVHRQGLEVAGIEESEEGFVVVSDAVEKGLRGAHDDKDRVILEKGAPVALLGHIETAEERVEILHEAHHDAPAQIAPQGVPELFQRHGRVFAEGGECAGGELIRVTLGQAAVDGDEQAEETGGGFVFIEPRHPHAAGEFRILAQPMLDQGHEVRLARSARPDKEQVMPPVREHALPHQGDTFGQQILALDQNLFEILRLRPLWRKMTEKRTFVHVTGCG